MTEPRVGIVVLNWNSWPDTLECLESLTQLNYPNFEVFVVDNDSSDESREHIARNFPQHTLLVADKNRGFASGNQLGIERAKAEGAEYIWLLNNDTVVAPDALTEMVNSARSSPEVGAIGSVIFHYDRPEVVQVWGGGQFNLWFGTARLHDGPPTSGVLNYLSAGSLLLRRTALDEAGGLDTNFFMYWEDADLCLRLCQSGWRLKVAERSYVWHKGSSSTGGLGSAAAYRMYVKSARTFFTRHSRLPAVTMGIRITGACLKWFLRRDWERLRVILSS